jgi:hypothetical protein
LRQVRYKEGKEFADSFGAYFVETSIKDSPTIDAAFQILIKTIYIKHLEGSFQGKTKAEHSNN